MTEATSTMEQTSGIESVLHENRVFVQVDRHANSFIVAFDLATGRELWKVERPELTADGSDDDLTDDGPNDLLFGWGNSGGIFSFQGSVDLSGALADASGDWEVTLIDQFDDFGPDHVYLSGSTVTITQVPAPAGLAILGLGGLAAARRKR